MVIEPKLKMPLTGHQARILDVIGEFIQVRHYPPTITEIQEVLKIANPGTVHKALSSLEKKQYISKEKNVARGIRLTSLGAEVCAASRQLNLELKELHQLKKP